MKKQLLIFTLLAFVFSMTGCLVIHEETRYRNYIYQNESSNDILVKSYSPFVKDGEILPGQDSVFTIPKNGQVKVTCWISPLNWHRDRTFDRDSVIISNGNREVINRKWENDPIYMSQSYKLISVKGKVKEKTYRFSFTDEFFDE